MVQPHTLDPLGKTGSAGVDYSAPANPIGEPMSEKTNEFKVFDFFFTARGFGRDADDALTKVIEEFESDSGNLFKSFVDYEEVDKEEVTEEEANKMLACTAEEAMLETLEPAEA
tara:strand:- start:176 stop:517 length:342 start_codon:yes stop_codon:yes gene_type:complete